MTIGSSVYIGTDGTGPGKETLSNQSLFTWTRGSSLEFRLMYWVLTNIILGGQWVRTRAGWRLSESDDSEPSKEEVQDLLGKHIKRESNRLMLEKASGISGAPRKFRGTISIFSNGTKVVLIRFLISTAINKKNIFKRLALVPPRTWPICQSFHGRLPNLDIPH